MDPLRPHMAPGIGFREQQEEPQFTDARRNAQIQLTVRWVRLRRKLEAAPFKSVVHADRKEAVVEFHLL